MARKSNFVKFIVVAALLSPILLKSKVINNETKKEKESPNILVSTGAIQRGGSLPQSLAQEGMKKEDVRAILNSFRPAFNLRYSRVGDPYEIYRSTSGEFLKLHYWVDPINYYAVKKSTAGFKLVKSELVNEEVTMGLVGTIQTSLWEAMAKQGMTPEMIIRFTDIFAWQIDFLAEPRAGDEFKVLWKRKQSDRGYVNGEIISALYNGAETKKLLASRYKGDYYLPDGKSLQRQFLRAPLKFSRISSYFSKRRFHPIMRVYRPHHGIDYVAAHGTPVSSVGDGEVVYKGWKGGNGNMIKIRHRNSSYSSIYGHLSRFSSGIRVGSNVHQGQVIGYVGSTGLSTGPHLHFAVEKNGSMINFLRLDLPSATVITDAVAKNEFNMISKKNEARMEGLIAKDNKPIVIKETGPLVASGSTKSNF